MSQYKKYRIDEETWKTLSQLHKTTSRTEGKTPAEACGIEVKGGNKWMTLIQNASL